MSGDPKYQDELSEEEAAKRRDAAEAKEKTFVETNAKGKLVCFFRFFWVNLGGCVR